MACCSMASKCVGGGGHVVSTVLSGVAEAMGSEARGGGKGLYCQLGVFALGLGWQPSSSKLPSGLRVPATTPTVQMGVVCAWWEGGVMQDTRQVYEAETGVERPYSANTRRTKKLKTLSKATANFNEIFPMQSKRSRFNPIRGSHFFSSILYLVLYIIYINIYYRQNLIRIKNESKKHFVKYRDEKINIGRY